MKKYRYLRDVRLFRTKPSRQNAKWDFPEFYSEMHPKYEQEFCG
jgi:hypothetical protein